MSARPTGARVPGVWRTACCVIVTTAALALPGCTGGDDPTPTPSPTPTTTSASPTPTPSPTDTTGVPEAARQNTEAGAEAFIRYYFDQYNLAMTTANPDLIRPLSEATCQFCSGSIEDIVGMRTNGEHYVSAPVATGSFEPVAHPPAGEHRFFVFVNQVGATVVTKSDVAVRTDPKQSGNTQVGVRWHDDRWLLRDIENA